MILLLLLLLAAEPERVAEDRAAAAQKFVEQLVAEDYTVAVETFDGTMKAALPAEKVAEVWKGTVALYGPWKKVVATRIEKAGKYDIVFVACQFESGQLDAKVVFSADGKIAGWFLVPAGKYQSPNYVDSEKFSEAEVEVGKGRFLLTLPGTLSLPKGDGRFAAVVLVHGSGPNDRDETIGPNKPFRDLAQGLASHGIAVLRYEKRTKQYPLAMSLSPKLTVKEETIDDALAAVELLTKQERIDPKRIYVLGHSLGGNLLPRIAERDERIAGFLSLAGSVRPLEDLVLSQTKYLLALDGLSDEDREAIAKLAAQVDLVKSNKLTLATPAKDLPLGSVPPAYWLDLRGYDPAALAKQIKRPLLILQGERDYQVTMEDFGLWKAALSDRRNTAFHTYPKLNHLFIPGDGQSRPAEYLQPGNVAEEVIVDIAEWILAANR